MQWLRQAACTQSTSPSATREMQRFREQDVIECACPAVEIK